ncbi:MULTISPECIES: trypsin-like peptidase domain-containing protein [unclassified Polaromonas]|uniref:S1C family serine protease n=1 Tax=unclassified Polaromonas TaxID=2638319 RepID=UPI000BC43331|nr:MULTISPECIES: trypsin-like peptidase domain-containing protein [unclassified Polaromonas]OYY33824.1 MAG: peptidase S1 [Polaromonas sp. 35-63-35]OYZ19485.1 MAG: peptidase S1 [Polaromonas sp. 16-63-31]OYZ77397.1 MAG: peptidase S1 [Polaromonas sp. 24-63-21]OZA48301.1 MAG: peptidase S1 [Polaromonas sp. 17-63-33]OZA86569.1 MAG: peptidase S1 [Polaromonas sp. 39-63-25]
MRRPALYSSSSSPPPAEAHEQQAQAGPAAESAPATRFFSLSSPRLLWAALAVMALLLVLSLSLALRPQPRRLTQADIHAAVLKTLETAQLPSAVAKAYDTIRPSVVRVTGYGKSRNGKEDEEYGVGTGVVIVDKGIILTNLHVVQGAQTIKVVFSDGLESIAHITGAQPENDLAVLQAHKIPDDMIAATMRSTGDLAPGDHVLAVGYPFGIGPSASAGVISGLKRTFRSPEGKQEMSNLIQFDAAANPGNSGGPLVTMDGEVVGIVTAILNPNQQRSFVGIAFAVPIENAASAVGLPPF